MVNTKAFAQCLLLKKLSPDFFFFFLRGENLRINYIIQVGISKRSFNSPWKFKGERISLNKMESRNLTGDLVRK